MGFNLLNLLPTVIGLFSHHHSNSNVQHLQQINPHEEWISAIQDVQQSINEYLKPQLELMRKYTIDEIQKLVRALREEHQRIKAELASKGLLNTAWGQNIYDKMTQKLEQGLEKMITQIHSMNLDTLRDLYIRLLTARANLALGTYRTAISASALHAQNEQQFGSALASAMSGLFENQSTNTQNTTPQFTTIDQQLFYQSSPNNYTPLIGDFESTLT